VKRYRWACSREWAEGAEGVLYFSTERSEALAAHGGEALPTLCISSTTADYRLFLGHRHAQKQRCHPTKQVRITLSPIW